MNLKSILDQDITRLTLTMYSDEVSCSKSSNIKIMRIFISINESKPQERRNFFFLIGVYVGKIKPPVQVFLSPFVEEIRSLSSHPMELKLNGRQELKVTCHLIGLIADAPMRAYLRNVKQYNHINGCDWRLIKATSANGARVFANLQQEEIQNLRRTRKDFIKFKEMLESHEDPIFTDEIQIPRFKGTDGISPLLKLPDFDIVEGTAVEPMHSISLGVFRNFILKGIINSNEKNLYESKITSNFFINELGERLSSIKVTSETTRIPRDLKQIKFWKSNEYDSFLCYFFYPTTRGLLKAAVINHISCLARVYYLSHNGPVTATNIQEIDNAVEEFQIETATLLGSRFLTYNLHILSHLSTSLCNLGPNSNASSYPLEDHMGKLKNKVRRYSNIGPALLRVFLNDLKFAETVEVKLKKWKLTDKEMKTFGIQVNSQRVKKIPLKDASSFLESEILEAIQNQIDNSDF